MPVPEDDPQQNPPDDPEGIKFISKRYTPDEEMEAVVKSIKGYVDLFADFPDRRTTDDCGACAAQCPRRGSGQCAEAKGYRADRVDLKSTSETRAAAGSLNMLLSYLADPQSARKLANAYRVWRRDLRRICRQDVGRRIEEEELLRRNSRSSQ